MALAQAVSPLTITLPFDDADELRPLLRAYEHAGITVAERSVWLIWRRFTIAGPAETMQRLRAALDKLEGEWFIRDAW
jgi:hypothetical protein